PHQTPGKWTFGVQGELVIARRSHPVTTPVPLPPELQEAVDSPFAGVRAGAVPELARLLRNRHAGLALAARLTLERLTQDDSRATSAAATAALQAHPPPPTTPPSVEGAQHASPEPAASEPAAPEPAAAGRPATTLPAVEPAAPAPPPRAGAPRARPRRGAVRGTAAGFDGRRRTRGRPDRRGAHNPAPRPDRRGGRVTARCPEAAAFA